jgi:hypothetical protein
LQHRCNLLHVAPPIPVAIATTGSLRALLPLKLLVAPLQQVPPKNTELLQAKPKLLQPVAVFVAARFQALFSCVPVMRALVLFASHE